MSDRAIKFTKIFIWVALSIIIGVDVWLAADGIKDNTISEVTEAYSWRWSTIPYAYGVLTGHLFWPIRGEIEDGAIRKASMITLGFIFVCLDSVDLYNVIPIIPVAFGVLIGHLCWPQTTSEKKFVVWNG